MANVYADISVFGVADVKLTVSDSILGPHHCIVFRVIDADGVTVAKVSLFDLPPAVIARLRNEPLLAPEPVKEPEPV